MYDPMSWTLTEESGVPSESVTVPFKRSWLKAVVLMLMQSMKSKRNILVFILNKNLTRTRGQFS
jgi:hypothetical protein